MKYRILVVTFVAIAALALVVGVVASKPAKAKVINFQYQDFSAVYHWFDAAGKLVTVEQRQASADGRVKYKTFNLKEGTSSGYIINDGKMHSGEGSQPIGQKLPAYTMTSTYWESQPGFVRRDTYKGYPVFVIVDPKTGDERWINPSFRNWPLKSTIAIGGEVVTTEMVTVHIEKQPDSLFTPSANK